MKQQPLYENYYLFIYIAKHYPKHNPISPVIPFLMSKMMKNITLVILLFAQLAFSQENKFRSEEVNY